MIFETKNLVIGYDDPLSKPINLTMERGQKIALTGANGLGKTTLLRSILGEIKPFSGEVELVVTGLAKNNCGIEAEFQLLSFVYFLERLAFFAAAVFLSS